MKFYRQIYIQYILTVQSNCNQIYKRLNKFNLKPGNVYVDAILYMNNEYTDFKGTVQRDGSG